jgi:hypothetical protein
MAMTRGHPMAAQSLRHIRHISGNPSQRRRQVQGPGPEGVVQRCPMGSRSGTAAVFHVTDKKAIVISIVHRLADTDFPLAELEPADFGQSGAVIDAFVFRQVSLFTIAARGGNHV